MAVIGGLLVFVGLVGIIFGVVNLIHPFSRARIPNRKIAGVVTGAAFVVMIVGAGISPRDDEEKPVAASPDATTSAVQVVEKATATPKPEKATNTPKPTETPKPTATPAPPTATPLPSNMKQIGDLLLTVNGASLYSEPNQFLRAEAGTHYVAVDITAQNTGPKTYALNALNFKLKDSDKYTSSYASTTKEPTIGHADMVPGQEVRGFLVFKLGDGRTPVELQYQSFTGTPGTIPVSLP